MNIDVHAHYVPTGSLEMAARIGARHGLQMQTAETGDPIVLRGGKPFLTQPKVEFSDLDLRLAIMEQQSIDMQVLSPAGSIRRRYGRSPARAPVNCSTSTAKKFNVEE